MKILSIDVSENTHIVDNYAVRHTIKKHARDTFPISKKNLKFIPIITKKILTLYRQVKIKKQISIGFCTQKK